MLYGEARSLKGHVEAVGGRCRSYHHDGRLAVAAVERLIKVGLLSLGGESRRGAAAHHVDYHQRQLGHDGQADGLTLQGEPRA